MEHQQPETLLETTLDLIAMHKESRALQLMLVWSIVSVLVLFPVHLIASLLVFFVLFGIGANALINTNRKYAIIDRSKVIWSVLS